MHYLYLRRALYTFALLAACGTDADSTDSTGTTGTSTSGTSPDANTSTGPTTTDAEDTSGTSTTQPVDTTLPEPTTSGTTMAVDPSDSTTLVDTTLVDTTLVDTTLADTTTGSTTDDDSSTGPDICQACQVSLKTDYSTALLATPGNEFLGSASTMRSIVWAVDEVEAGRVAYATSSDMLNNENTACDLWPWLAGTDAEPRVLATGSFICDVQDWNGLGDLQDFTYSDELPVEYIGKPDALRADFDIVIFCVNNFGNPDPIDAATYVDYVKLHGGGLYLAGSHQLDDPSEDIALLNEIAGPLGAEYQSEYLMWEGGAGTEFTCFPEQG
jgi:hypothetical protein